MAKGHFYAHHYEMHNQNFAKKFFALVFSLCMEKEFNESFLILECAGIGKYTANVSLVVKYSEDHSLLFSKKEKLVCG